MGVVRIQNTKYLITQHARKRFLQRRHIPAVTTDYVIALLARDDPLAVWEMGLDYGMPLMTLVTILPADGTSLVRTGVLRRQRKNKKRRRC